MVTFSIPQSPSHPLGLRDRGRPVAAIQPLLSAPPVVPDASTAGLNAAAQGLAEIADIATRKAAVERQRTERLTVARTVAEEDERWAKELIARQETVQPGAENFAKSTLADFDTRKADILGNQDLGLSEDGRAELELRLTHLRGDVAGKAMSFETGARLAKKREDVDVVTRLGAAAVARDPSSFADKLADVESATRNLGLPPIELERELNKARSSLATAALMSLADRNPAAAMVAMGSGAYDRYVEPNQMISLRSYAKAEDRRARSEAVAASREERAQARVQWQMLAGDASTAFSRGDRYDLPKDWEWLAVKALGPEAGGAAVEQMMKAQEAAPEIAALAGLPPDKQDQILAARKPSGPGYQWQAHLYDDMTRRVKRSRDERAKALQPKILDEISAYRRGEEVPNPIGYDVILGAFGDDGEAIARDLDQARQMAGVLRDVAGQSPEAQAKALERFRPTAGTDGYKAAAERYDMLAGAIRQDRKARADDPGGYVAKMSPALANLVTEAQTAESAGRPQDAARAWGTAIALSEELQKTAGIPAYDRRVMPKAMATDMVARLGALPGEAKATALNALKSTFGDDHWPKIFGELRQAGLPDEFEALALARNDVVAKRMGEALDQGEALAKAAGAQGRKVKDALGDGLADFRASLANVPDGFSAYARVQGAAEKLALSYVTSGLDGPTAAARAVADTIGAKYDFWPQADGVTARLPKGAHDNAVALTTRTLEGLRADALADPGGSGAATAALTADQRKMALVDSLKVSGRWVTNGRDDGLILFDAAMRPVLRADGSPFEVKFSAFGGMVDTPFSGGGP